MPSQQLELKSDITNLFKDLESIAKDTKVNAPHVPKIEQADITELFSGLNVAHEEAKIEVELRLSLEEKNELDTFTSLVDTFSEITNPVATWPNEQPPEYYEPQKPVDESAKLQALEELFSTITEPNSEDIVVDEIKVDTISEEPTSVEKTASMIDKAIVHLDSLEGKTEITEEVNQIATLRKEFDNFRSLIAQQIASSQMSGAGGGEVRLEFMDDVDRTTAKVDGKFLKYQSSTGKFIGADAGVTNEQLQDVVGAMISSNTESGITVTYEDSDGTLDFVVGTLNQDTTGNSATSTALETARTIAGVSFDGTSNISIASTDLSNTSNITLLTSTQTLTNKTLTSPVINTGITGTAFLDEDDLASNSATKIASQQSIKAYVDAAELRTRAFAIAIGAGL
jgi:predicted DNA binding CopG/RHH family protein